MPNSDLGSHCSINRNLDSGVAIAAQSSDRNEVRRSGVIKFGAYDIYGDGRSRLIARDP